jgi:nucleotide-binding universal stress UspA family protein
VRYVVGYTENDRGQDAVELATSLALTQSAGIDLVTVLDWPQDGSVAPGGRRAKAAVPDGVEVTTHVRPADSFAEGAVGVAVEPAARRGLPLRLGSLVALDIQESTDTGEAINRAHQHVNSVLVRAEGKLPEGHRTSVVVTHGRTIEEAIDEIEWDAGELVIVGSSRLARHRQIFLGATANKMLRALPVPMVVVPREWVRSGP